jgi:tetratricopeptide (TPR) repeat protein
MVISTFKKIASVFLGLILLLVLLEAGLRLGGSVLSSLQEYGNLQSIKQKGAYRILCLGESTTEGGYPHLLEQVLNQHNIGVRFSVIDKGIASTNTFFILSNIESYLAEYRPDMVVAMMGNLDQGNRYYQDIPEADTWIFRHSRLYRLARMHFMHIFRKIKREDINRFRGPDPGMRAQPIDTGTLPGNVKLWNEMPAEKVAKLDFNANEGSPGPRSPSLSRSGFSTVEESLKKAIELDPKNDHACVGLGLLYLEQGKFPQVGNLFRKAIALNPKNNDAYVGLGRFSLEQGRFPQAEDRFKKAIELDPKGEHAYVELGRLYQVQGKLSQAEDCFKKAIELNPKSDDAYVGFGGFYLLQDKFFQSKNSFKKAIALNPKNDKAYVGLGRLYGKHGKFSQSEELLSKAVELNPENDSNRNALGMIFRIQGKFQQAEDSFTKAVELNPANMRNLFQLVALLREQGKLAQSENALKKASELYPNDSRILVGMASLCGEMGKSELAKQYTEKANRLKSSAAYYAPITVHNYRKLKDILDRKGIKLVCVQYPMQDVAPLKRIFEKDDGVIFVDNERVFKEAVMRSGYKEYFRDMIAGDFGHCTQKGNELLSQNIAEVILREVFNKQ